MQLAKVSLKEHLVFLLLAIAAAAIIRLDFLFANDWVIDSDEAIVGLMALHIAAGQGIPVFYYGQHYMGTLEPILVSIGFLLFGPSNITLQLIPLLFSLALIPLVFVMALEVAGPYAARVAALLCAIPPTTLVVWSSKARGGFIEIVFIGALALYLTIRWLKRELPEKPLTFLIGILLGFGWWVNNQIIFFMVPVAVFMAARLRDLPGPWLMGLARHGLIGLAGFILGGLPFWIYNLQNNFVSFQMFKGAGVTKLLDQWAGLFTTALPIILGAKRFWYESDIFPLSTLLIGILYILLFTYLAYERRAELAKLWRLRCERNAPLEIFIVFFVASITVFACSSFGYLFTAPRYLLPSYVALFILTGFTLERIRRRNALLSSGLLGLILTFNVASSYYGGRAIPGEPMVEFGQRVSKDHSELIAWLKKHNHKWVRTNYWIGYKLAFESKEEIRFLIFGHPHYTRINDYPAEARNLDYITMPLVLVPGQANIVEKALTSLGWRYRVEDLSGYRVVHSIDAPPHLMSRIDPGQMVASATNSKDSAPLAVDGKYDTRWGSGAPQAPGMAFEVRFSSPKHLRSIKVTYDGWPHDYPRGLRIVTKTADGQEHSLIDEASYSAILYFDEFDSPLYELRTPPLQLFIDDRDVVSVTFTQTGEHPILDWSMAEIEFFE